MSLRIKNWSKFQHFRDRRPPWIKLYRDILDDREWHKLDGESAKTLVMIWLVASEDEGRLPDLETLAFRLRLDEKPLKSMISKLSHWLEQDDIAVISERYQSDSPETETEGEREAEKEGEGETEVVAPPSKSKAPKQERRKLISAQQMVDQLKGLSLQAASDYIDHRRIKKAPLTERAFSFIAAEIRKAHIAPDEAISKAIARNWTGIEAEWLANGSKGGQASARDEGRAAAARSMFSDGDDDEGGSRGRRIIDIN